MFLESSRYYNLKPADITTKDGNLVKVVPIRRLPIVDGNPTVIKGNDRLDIIANQHYDNSTMFWHIADANTELQANDLIRMSDHVHTIKVPEK